MAAQGRVIGGPGTIQDAPNLHTGGSSNEPNGLPSPVLVLLQAAERAGYRVKWKNRQNTSLMHNGRYVGGWNRPARHWHIRDSAVGKNAVLLRKHGFSLHSRATAQRHWQLAGVAGASALRSVVGDLTGVPIIE